MSDEEAEERTNHIPLLPVRAGGALLVVPALQVVEVVDVGELLFLPRAPAHVPGLLNLRGSALPVLDLAGYLGLIDGAAPESGAFPRIVVVEASEMCVGMQCSAVLGVLQAHECPSRPPGQHDGVLGEIALAEVELAAGLATHIDLSGLLERARVRQ